MYIYIYLRIRLKIMESNSFNSEINSHEKYIYKSIIFAIKTFQICRTNNEWKTNTICRNNWTGILICGMADRHIRLLESSRKYKKKYS